MKTFVLNGKTYPIKDMGVNMICDFEDMGISLNDMQNKTFSFVRAYIAMCMNSTLEKAGREIELHLMNKGKMDDLMNPLKDAMENSDFFRALQENEETETTTEKKSKKSI